MVVVVKLGLDERATARRWVPVLLALLVAVGAVGAWITYDSYTAPTTTVDRQTVTTWESDAYFDYRGVVAVENSVYPVGTELPGSEFYLKKIAPDFEGQLVYAYRTDYEGELTVTADVLLVYHEVDGRSGTEYWRVVEPLNAVERRIAPGEELRVPFAVDVPAVESRLEATRAEVGQLPARTDSEVLVLVQTNAVGTVDGDRVREFEEYALPIRFQRDVYAVDDPRVTTTTHEATRTTVVPVDPDPVARNGGPALLAVGLLGAAALATLRYRGAFDLTEAERTYLQYRADRAAFDEWITTFSPAEEVFALPRTDAASLADLVDFAINTDSGVIESPDGTAFLVVHGGHRYCFDAPPDPREGSPTDPSEGEANAPDAGSDSPGDPGEVSDPGSAARSPALTEGSSPVDAATDGGDDDSPVADRAERTGEERDDRTRAERDDRTRAERDERPGEVHRPAAEEMVGGRIPTHTTADRTGEVPDWLRKIADEQDD